MSTEASLQVHIEPSSKIGLIRCPGCGFEIPDTIVVCWKCGKRLKK
jgi:ribosomal protein S27E